MRLTVTDIIDNKSEWIKKGFILPEYDLKEIADNTRSAPEWIHIGAGNLFRAYIACIADELIKKGELKSGIIAVDCFGSEPIDKIYRPFDNLIIYVGLRPDGEKYLRVLGSVGRSVAAAGEGLEELSKYAAMSSLKMISFTVTEKGYSVRDTSGSIIPELLQDIENGPYFRLNTVLAKVSLLLLKRFIAGRKPIALVSMDNCSRNGDRLREGILLTVHGWCEKGYTGKDFYDYVSDRSKVSFPCTMIDKITPRPDPDIADMLSGMSIEDMQPVITGRGTHLAPYVNAEMLQYLVIEDDFPGGRPSLEQAGVYLTDRNTVEQAEKMKVSTCLNPLHTALAIFGCLLGYKKISDEMSDADLKNLVYILGYYEGLPVAADPGIINPKEFLDEVLTKRLTNNALPDTPQRIATDTSRKMAVRFGETIKEYVSDGRADILIMIPLVIAGWFRYITGIDDEGNEMELSQDPMSDYLKQYIKADMFGKDVISDEEKKGITEMLQNSEIFGTDLESAGLSERKRAVRNTLKEAVSMITDARRNYDEKKNCSVCR